MSKLFIFLCFLGLLSCIHGYRVLVVFPLAVRSINLLGEGFVRHLIKAGHEVTYVTAFPLKNPYKTNFTQVDVSSTMQQQVANDNILNLEYIMETALETDILHIQNFGLEGAVGAFKDKNLRGLLADTSLKFDVVLADFIETEIYAGLAALYDCPMIWAYSIGAHTVALKLIDQPANPSYTMDYLTYNVVPFSFYQRVEQLWAQIKWFYYKKFYTIAKEEALYKEFFGPYMTQRGRDLPDYQELIYNASLIFANDHHSVGNIPATPQNFKFIGGFHIEDTPKPLPKDLQTIMDSAKHGVIYFSMGSTWKSKDIPKQVTNDLLKMFGELKQTVIWKYEEALPNTPSNLHIVKWAPQQSILAHPNLLFFITHGGHLSSTEAFHFGVPIIGVPIYFDQITNIKKAVQCGYAAMVKLSKNLANDLRPAVNEFLTNSKYREKARELSWIYHHRPSKPGVEMVHWVEHVIKTKGAPHLRSPALHMPVYQKFYLDLAAVVLAGLYTVVWVFKQLFRLLSAGPSQHEKLKARKNK